MCKEDTTFDNLRKEINKRTYKAWARAMWISEVTWRLADQRTPLRRKHPVDQRGLRTASRRFQATLKEDRRRRLSMTGTNIKALLTEGKTREAWGTIKRWYHKTKYHPPPPTMEGMYHTSILKEGI